MLLESHKSASLSMYGFARLEEQSGIFEMFFCVWVEEEFCDITNQSLLL